MNPRVVSTESVNLRQSKEAKAAQALLKNLDTLTFDHRAFAFQIMVADTELQKRMMTTILAVIDMWADAYDSFTWKNEGEMYLQMKARQIVDFLDNFTSYGE